jgi:C1A family cysteine protease
MGWMPDLPDPRDYTPEHTRIRPLLERLKRHRKRSLPPQIDLRQDADGVYFSPTEDQGPLACSSVFACLCLVEYFERRTLGNTFDPSKLFLYKTARKLRGMPGNSGIDLRSTFKALVRYGVPPEEFWPYRPAAFDDELHDLTLLGFARDFAALRYFRLDLPDKTGVEVLQRVKSFLSARFPVAFGFPVPRSLNGGAEIPYRPTFDAIRGGQAVLAVGYDDNHRAATKGAILIRSSWGTAWGEAGCGWLPYPYVLERLACDFWTLLRDDWLKSGELVSPFT